MRRRSRRSKTRKLLFRKDPEKKNVGSEKKKAPQDQAEGENLA